MNGFSISYFILMSFSISIISIIVIITFTTNILILLIMEKKRKKYFDMPLKSIYLSIDLSIGF